MAIRERVDRSMHLDAGPQPLGQAPVLEPLDAPLDEVAEQVSKAQLVVITSQEEVNEIVHTSLASSVISALSTLDTGQFFSASLANCAKRDPSRPGTVARRVSAERLMRKP